MNFKSMCLKINGRLLLFGILFLTSHCQARNYKNDSAMQSDRSLSPISSNVYFEKKYALSLQIADIKYSENIGSMPERFEDLFARIQAMQAVLLLENLQNGKSISLLRNQAGEAGRIDFIPGTKAGEFEIDDSDMRTALHDKKLKKIVKPGFILALCLACEIGIGVNMALVPDAEPCDLQTQQSIGERCSSNCSNLPPGAPPAGEEAGLPQCISCEQQAQSACLQRSVQHYFAVQNKLRLGLIGGTVAILGIVLPVGLMPIYLPLKKREKNKRKTRDFLLELQKNKKSNITSYIEIVQFMATQLNMTINPELAKFAPELAPFFGMKG